MYKDWPFPTQHNTLEVCPSLFFFFVFRKLCYFATLRYLSNQLSTLCYYKEILIVHLKHCSADFLARPEWTGPI